ncbi:MAG: hypothetical protein DRH93_01235 [Deltaproteobacteria bacterium]|nr:MAG: hypothetical protein DRH93_01235 [Deltaproteobacteria bacterium]
MDYKTLENSLDQCVGDNSQELNKVKQILVSLHAQDAFDKRILTTFNNLVKTLKITESFKRIVRNILNKANYFSDNSVHHTTKAQQLLQILDDNHFLENNKKFNLSILQTYMENILNKQLLEINIKIEENQRILHHLERNRSKSTETAKESRRTQFLFIENEKIKYAIRYSSIIEILKINKSVTKKNINAKVIPYSKVTGLNRRNILKKINTYTIQKNQPLNNVNVNLTNSVDKLFAVITRKENYLNIFFVDNILHTDAVEAQDMGSYAKTFQENYKTIEV